MALEVRQVALRELQLPFEHVIVSHGEPVHDRAAYARALELEPCAGREARRPAASIDASRSHLPRASSTA